MIRSSGFIVRYFLFLMIYFIILKTIFIICNYSLLNEITTHDYFNIYLKGLKLDASASSYILLIPLAIMIITLLLKMPRLRFFSIQSYTVIVLMFVSFIAISDAELYGEWKYRIDSTVLLYLQNPSDIFNSISMIKTVLLLLAWIVLAVVSLFLYKKIVCPEILKKESKRFLPAFTTLIIAAATIIPLRGGIGVSPINIGSAYFHNNMIVNHCTVNMLWNLGYSLLNKDELSQEYNFHSEEEALKNISQLKYETDNTTEKVLQKERPNIIIIITESFTANIPPMYLKPVYDKGISFNNLYASGDRTDKGLVAIFSGFPSQPGTSIIKYPDKTAKLPSFIRELKKEGYNAKFYYGGDPSFSNYNSYLLQCGFDMIVDETDFPKNQRLQKWGVPDEYVFNRIHNDIKNTSSPFFFSVLTLSNHPPYDIPSLKDSTGLTDAELFNATYRYTEEQIARFIEELEKDSSIWNNTLVIVTADHGTSIIGNYNIDDEKKYRIPMLWTGGTTAKHGTRINKYMSQTDIGRTLLNQLNIRKEYNDIFSKDVFNPNSPSYAFFIFNDGFGYIDDNKHYTYNKKNNTLKTIYGTIEEKDITLGKSYIQIIMSELKK